MSHVEELEPDRSEFQSETVENDERVDSLNIKVANAAKSVTGIKHRFDDLAMERVQAAALITEEEEEEKEKPSVPGVSFDWSGVGELMVRRGTNPHCPAKVWVRQAED